MQTEGFIAIRPRPEYAARVACPPYDVVSREEAAAIIAREPLSFLRVVRPDADPECPAADAQGQYVWAAQRLGKMLDQGVLIRDDQPRIYLYQMEDGQHAQLGIALCLDANLYWSGIIKAHEKIREQPFKDRLHHIQTVKAQTGPVLCFAEFPSAGLEMLLEKCSAPLYELKDETGVVHRLWPLTGKVGPAIPWLKESQSIYIADGHHRMAAAAEVARAPEAFGLGAEARGILCVLFPASSMFTLPYNRFVTELPLPVAEFEKILKERFGAQPAEGESVPRRPEVIVYLKGRNYRICFPDASTQPGEHKPLACELLQERILGPILDIRDPRTDSRIGFIGGYGADRRARDKVDSGEAAVAFLLPAVDVATIMQRADQGRTMPPKSTWFEPKLRSGLLIHPLV